MEKHQHTRVLAMIPHDIEAAMYLTEGVSKAQQSGDFSDTFPI